MASPVQQEPLDLSMKKPKKTDKRDLCETPKANFIIDSLYESGFRVFDNHGNKYR